MSRLNNCVATNLHVRETDVVVVSGMSCGLGEERERVQHEKTILYWNAAWLIRAAWPWVSGIFLLIRSLYIKTLIPDSECDSFIFVPTVRRSGELYILRLMVLGTVVYLRVTVSNQQLWLPCTVHQRNMSFPFCCSKLIELSKNARFGSVIRCH